jgi:N utilization substance protein B
MSSPYSTRRLSRLAAVQGIYQHIIDQESVSVILNQFKNHHFKDGILKSKIEPDFYLFSSILENTAKNKEEYNDIIAGYLNTNRLPILSNAIVLCAMYEILNHKDLHKNIIINEYVSISKEFLSEKEISFINGILEEMAEKLRNPKEDNLDL